MSFIDKNPEPMGGIGGGGGSGLDNMAGAPQTDLPPVSAVEPTEDGGYEITFGEEERTEDPAYADFYENLADTLADNILDNIGTQVIEGFEADITSRQDWENTLVKGIDLLGLRIDDTAVPFQGACNAVHPLVIENCVKFQAKAIAELFPPGGPVKTQIIGNQTDDVIAAANRVKEYMNFQLTEEMPEYVEEEERLLFYTAFAGISFKKVYFNAVEERPCAEFVKATDFIVSNYASDLKSAERYTHRMYKSKIDIDRLTREGVYSKDVELGGPVNPKLSDFEIKMNKKLGINQNDTPDRTPGYTILEQHCYLGDTLAEEGLPAPYVVTVEYNSRKVLAIRRNWKKSDKKFRKRVWFVKYSFVPSDGFYSFGFVHLIGGIAKTSTLIMRSLADAGQFANLQGGFKLKGVKIVKNEGPISPGEFRDVEVPGMQKLTDTIVPFNYKEPSPALFELLQFMVAAGQKFADTTDMVVSDSSSYGPVGTILALLDASSKFFSSVHKRLHKSMRDELRILKEINRETLPKVYPYDVAGAPRQIYQADFGGQVNLIPVSDPNIATQAQRTAIAQAVVSMTQQAPQIHDVREAYKRVYQNMGIQDIEKILPPPAEAVPADPLTDLIAVSQGKPIAAFNGQDHQAHVTVKGAWLQDPANGMNPMMAQVAPLVQANIRQHMIMQYQEQLQGLMQQQLGPQALQPQPQPGQPPQPGQLPPQILGKVMAAAAQQIQQANQSAAVSDPDKQIADSAQTEALAKIGDLARKQQLDVIQASQRERELDIREQEVHLRAVDAGMKTMQAGKDAAKNRSAQVASTAINALATLSKPQPKVSR